MQLKRRECEDKALQVRESMERQDRERTARKALEKELEECREDCLRRLAQAERERDEAVKDMVRQVDSLRQEQEREKEGRERQLHQAERERERQRVCAAELERVRQRERERDAEDLQQVQGRVEEHRQRIMELERDCDKDRTELARAREEGNDLERARQRETPGNEAEQRAVRERLLSQQMVLQQAARQAGGSPAASTAEASDTAAAAVQQKPIGYELHTRLSRGEGVLDVLETEEGACSVPSVSIRTRSLRHASVRGRLGVDLT